MLFGIEKEYFLVENDQPILVPPVLPSDDCGWLVEVRGKPANTISEAVYSILCNERTILKDLAKWNVQNGTNYEVSHASYMVIPQALRTQARRTRTKGLLKYQNLYGKELPQLGRTGTAGLHLSVTFPQSIWYKDESYPYNAIWDFPTFFRYLDKAFADEIKENKRRQGFYEIKSDGRIEYRSLPANIDLEKLMSVVESYKF